MVAPEETVIAGILRFGRGRGEKREIGNSYLIEVTWEGDLFKETSSRS